MPDEKIPLQRVLDDMYDPNGGLVSWAARDYYYTTYATPEEQKRMDREEKLQALFSFLVMIGVALFLIATIITSIF